MSRLQEELKQSKPFANASEEAFLLIVRTADKLTRALAAALKPHGISPTQYNVLRILRGAGAEGRTCGEIGERMITRDPDITRLLDRMEKRGWLTRSRGEQDRRVITATITPEGTRLLKRLDAVVDSVQRECLASLGDRRLRELSGLLEQVGCAKRS